VTVRAQRGARQPADVAASGARQVIRAGVGHEGAHTPRRLRGQRIGDERNARPPREHQPDRRARRGVHAQTDSLPERQGEGATGAEARGVDPGRATWWRSELRRDARREGRAGRVGACRRGDQELRDRIVGQRQPRDPRTVLEHRHRLPVDAQAYSLSATPHRAEQECRVVRLDDVGGGGIDDSDVQRFAPGRGRRGDGRAAGARNGASGDDTREQHADRSHRTRKVASALSASQFAECIGRPYLLRSVEHLRQ
jgi:hypothetical protein